MTLTASGAVVPIDTFCKLGWTERIIPICPATQVPGLNSPQWGKVPAKLSRGKVYPSKEWQTSRASDADVQRWEGWQFDGMPFNFGMQTHGLLVIDSDIDDPAAAATVMQTMREVFQHKPPIRTRPDASRFAALFRVDTPRKKEVVKIVGGKVELLGDGQQFVVTGNHYESGQPIIWLTPPVSLGALPLATSAQIEQFMVLVHQRLGSPSAPLLPAGSATHPRRSRIGCVPTVFATGLILRSCKLP